MEHNPIIDSGHIRYIVSQFKKHWEQRLLSLNLRIMDELTKPCFLNYSRQFMQIHRIPNILFLNLHI
jgi:hypothetical protein